MTVQEHNKILNDLNKVFIPCRTVLEMEALISLYLLDHNYNHIKEVPHTRPSSEHLIKILGYQDTPFYMDIIDFFINCAIPKVKPLVTYARDNHDRIRMGNIIPYSKTRVCVYLALHQLKLKFLIIKSIIDKFKEKIPNKTYSNLTRQEKNVKIHLTEFSEEYYLKNKMNLTILFPKSKASDRVKKMLKNDHSITGEKLLEMATSREFFDKNNIIKFIMREIKASVFVCKLMFAKMDLADPFSKTEETMIDAEEVMTSNDFIPELIPAICQNMDENNLDQLKSCIGAFYFLLDKVFEGINRAVEIASRGQLQLEIYEPIYYTGNILSI
ncbi:MAG: hypothetical protein BAJALOKI1v1_1630004 [Promethearchaeota archaeon]|nr:MAG: hypothetical protein BAJALOKI1v1_1630004 [Candidatus Lokiarchaeota archaeon]